MTKGFAVFRSSTLASLRLWLGLWAVASALLLVSGWVSPTALGYAFVIGQAEVVALLGELQYIGLRRPLAAANS